MRRTESRSRCAAALLAALSFFVSGARAQGIALAARSPAAVGLDSSMLAGAPDAAAALPALTSLIVWRSDAIAYEGYFHGGARDTPVNIKSVAKSFLSALVGVVVAERRVLNVAQPVSEVLPEFFGPTGGSLFSAARLRSDSLRRLVTWRHLLTMSSAMTWDEMSLPLSSALLTSSNPVRFAAELPVLSAPGTAFNYSTASTHLLAGALARRVGMPLRQYAEQHLFGPAGIIVTRWDADPQGVPFGGSEMFMTTREMLKLGVLYTRKGRVGARQVVPADWIAESTTRKIDMAQPAYRSMVPNAAGYGYLWWLRASGGREMVCALGLGGQFVLMVPTLDLVIAGTSRLDAVNPGNDRQFSAIFDLVDRFIVPAAR